MKRYAISLFILGLSILSIGFWLLLPPVSQAQEDATAEVTAVAPEQTEVASSDPQPTGDNSFCILCHSASTPAQYVLADGTSIPVNVDASHVANSVHSDLGCVDCHAEKTYPHERILAANAREYSISQSNLCLNCHSEQVDAMGGDIHYEALLNGNLRAATCTDCHGSHEIQDPSNHIQIAETCGNCHQIVLRDYSASVHGVALANGDENVPTCVSCHGVHGIEHPTTAEFRNSSPELCATCHADTEMMADYDISTNVFNSYIDDFHGTTVELFEQSATNIASNKAVCYDCHGVHNILAPDDENSRVIQSNLLTTCRECHPNASSDFPNSWLGHYEPTFESHPLLTLVNLFYAIVIPVTVGVFVFLVATDIIRIIRQRLSGH